MPHVPLSPSIARTTAGASRTRASSTSSTIRSAGSAEMRTSSREFRSTVPPPLLRQGSVSLTARINSIYSSCIYRKSANAGSGGHAVSAAP